MTGFMDQGHKYEVFNTDNNQKCFLSSNSAYYNDFWRSWDTEDWSNDAENSFNFNILQYIHILIVIIFCKNIQKKYSLMKSNFINWLKVICDRGRA